jgi:Uma2 family endonuclease
MRPSISVDPFTVEDFFAFTAARPDGEKWELIEGFPVCDATGTWHHQRLLGGVLGALWDTCRERPYEVLPGFAVRLSPHDVAVSAMVVRPRRSIEPTSCVCDDAIIAVEVLSPLTADRDLRWKRQLYPTLPSLQHYVIVTQDAVEVFAYDRQHSFRERRFGAPEDVLDFPSIAAPISLDEIYSAVCPSLQLPLPMVPANGHTLQARACR